MSQAKIVITDYIEDNLDWEVDQMAERDIDFEHHQLKLAPEDELVDAIRDCDVVIVNMAPMPESVISQLENCRLIIRHGIGYDNVDTEACTKYGIRLANIPDYCAQEVSEQALALIFACARRLFQSRAILEESSASGIWDFSELGDIHRMQGLPGDLFVRKLERLAAGREEAGKKESACQGRTAQVRNSEMVQGNYSKIWGRRILPGLDRPGCIESIQLM